VTKNVYIIFLLSALREIFNFKILMHIVLLEVNFHLKHHLMKIFCPIIVHKIKLFHFDWAEVNSLHR